MKLGCAGDKSHNPYTAWRAVLCVTPYIRVKRGCAGDIVQIPTTAWRAVHRDCLADELQRRTCFSLLSHSENFLYSYIIDYHVVERALNVEEVGGRRESQRAAPKRAVRQGCHIDCYSILRSEGPTPIVLIHVFRCRTYSAP